MNLYIGIDVQVKRGLPFSVLDPDGRVVDSGWLESDFTAGLEDLLRRTAGTPYVGIDSPRLPLVDPRPWYWDRKSAGWRPRAGEVGCGRHCEVVLSALGLANPQWTPLGPGCPEWMQLGFQLFRTLYGRVPTLEVFPTASYSQLASDRTARMDIDLSGFRRGPKDMLDACVAALTVREFVEGRGCEVGGGDGLGTIVLPRPIRDPRLGPLQAWPV